jgi:hypothetical protein
MIVFWLGPIYEVRRGSWFFQEGSTLRPCEENLAAQLEEVSLDFSGYNFLLPVYCKQFTPQLPSG